MTDIWIGIDTGGTFTDVVLVDFAMRRHVFHKVPSSTADPACAILDGTREILDLAGIAAGRVDHLALGTTLATNAVIERKCAPTGLITTRGFRDVLELARQRRPHRGDRAHRPRRRRGPAARRGRDRGRGREAADPRARRGGDLLPPFLRQSGA